MENSFLGKNIWERIIKLNNDNDLFLVRIVLHWSKWRDIIYYYFFLKGGSSCNRLISLIYWGKNCLRNLYKYDGFTLTPYCVSYVYSVSLKLFPLHYIKIELFDCSNISNFWSFFRLVKLFFRKNEMSSFQVLFFSFSYLK